MKELLNTINNIKNNGVSTLVNIFTKKDQDKIINKVLKTDKFKKIYKDIDKEKAINIFKSNFILLAAKEDNKNFNRDFIVYDNGGSKEVFLCFEGSRARKWSIEGELIEIKADTEQQGKEVGKMNNKKELRPIYNEDIKGHKEYILEELKKYNSGDLNFTHKRINNKMIEEYTKYFVYKDNTFMAVKPSENGYPSGYYDHVKQYNYRVDHINKIILFTDSEVGEVQQEEIKEEFYNIDTVDLIEEKKENNNYITLTEEQKKERKHLINLWSTKTPNDKQQGKESFLNLLFKYQEQKKTKEEFKKHINKLYAANKNIKAANAGKKDFNNYLVDILATEDILQKNDIIKNEFFTNSYNYIKCI